MRRVLTLKNALTTAAKPAEAKPHVARTTYYKGDSFREPAILQGGTWGGMQEFSTSGSATQPFVLREDLVQCALESEAMGGKVDNPALGMYGRVWVRDSTEVPDEDDLPTSVCTFDDTYPADGTTNVRTVDATGTPTSALGTATTPEIFYAGAWHPICGYGFGDSNDGATTLCKQLGFEAGTVSRTVAPVRLVGGSSKQERVKGTDDVYRFVRKSATPEVFYKGEWYPICGHQFWENNDGATTLCRQLGFESGSVWGKGKERKYSKNAMFVGVCGRGEPLNWCGGHKGSFGDLRGQCNKGEDVAIMITCTGPTGGSEQTTSTSSSPASVPAYSKDAMPVGKCLPGESLTSCTGGSWGSLANNWGNMGAEHCRKGKDIAVNLTCTGGSAQQTTSSLPVDPFAVTGPPVADIACKTCPAGKTDHDSDPGTPCFPCTAGVDFADKPGAAGPCTLITTTSTTTTATTTTTTATTTTTKLCNGKGDPTNCAAKYSVDYCQDPVSGASIREGCPVLCGTCEPLLCSGVPDPALCVAITEMDCSDPITGKAYRAECPATCGVCPTSSTTTTTTTATVTTATSTTTTSTTSTTTTTATEVAATIEGAAATVGAAADTDTAADAANPAADAAADASTTPPDKCNAFTCSLDCEDECGWVRSTNTCVSSALGAQTSERERQDRLGDCPDASADGSSDTGGEEGGGDDGSTLLIVCVATAVLAGLACAGYFLTRRGGSDAVVTGGQSVGVFNNNNSSSNSNAALGSVGQYSAAPVAPAGPYGFAWQGAAAAKGAPNSNHAPQYALGPAATTQNATYDLGHANPNNATYDLGHANPDGATYDLGHVKANDATYDLGHANPDSATYDLGHANPDGATYDLGHVKANDATYDLGHANPNDATYDLGSGGVPLNAVDGKAPHDVTADYGGSSEEEI